MVFGWIIRFLVVMVLLRMAWKFLAGLVEGVSTQTPAPPPVKGISLVRDPVCGTHLDRNRALTLRRKGETYYFCSTDCRTAFEQDPRTAARRA